ncbi:MAG: radical SAM protein [Clostridia bacterium]|nr:radical SAM protein [Clostridia bacterium]
MHLNIFGKGFNYSQDGPGNRLVYHLSGCHLRCPWCSNPEGLFGSGRVVEAQEIVREVLSARPMFFDGGGVTFTGGECTLQAAALLFVIGQLKAAGVNVAMESNAATKDFLSLASVCDIVIADYKHPDATILRTVTGGDLALIESNLSSLIGQRFVHLRIPLVHAFNDDDAAIDGFVRFFSQLPRERYDVEILSYHEYGKEKWHTCSKEYTVTDGYVEPQRIQALTATLREAGVRVIKT